MMSSDWEFKRGDIVANIGGIRKCLVIGVHNGRRSLIRSSRDLNPGCRFNPHNTLAGCRLQPLGHYSKCMLLFYSIIKKNILKEFF